MREENSQLGWNAVSWSVEFDVAFGPTSLVDFHHVDDESNGAASSLDTMGAHGRAEKFATVTAPGCKAGIQ